MIFYLQEEFEFPPQLPPQTEIDGNDTTPTNCLGRWPAEVHVACYGFTNDSFIPANFVLLNEDQFAVILPGRNSTYLYNRLKETEEICNAATANTGNSEEENSPGQRRRRCDILLI